MAIGLLVEQINSPDEGRFVVVAHDFIHEVCVFVCVDEYGRFHRFPAYRMQLCTKVTQPKWFERAAFGEHGAFAREAHDAAQEDVAGGEA